MAPAPDVLPLVVLEQYGLRRVCCKQASARTGLLQYLPMLRAALASSGVQAGPTFTSTEFGHNVQKIEAGSSMALYAKSILRGKVCLAPHALE